MMKMRNVLQETVMSVNVRLEGWENCNDLPHSLGFVPYPVLSTNIWGWVEKTIMGMVQKGVRYRCAKHPVGRFGNGT